MHAIVCDTVTRRRGRVVPLLRHYCATFADTKAKTTRMGTPSSIASYFKAPTVPTVPIVPIVPRPTESVDEQEFIDFFAGIAKHPLFKGQPTTNRKVAVFGQKYFWGDDVSHGLSAIPKSFKSWCRAHGYSSKVNSILINVYTEPSSNIDWHSDTTTKLKKPTVTSISFALKVKDRDKKLAELEFRWPSKQDPKKKTVKTQTLRHGTVIKFDALKHKKKLCEHRVAKTALPRVNVTMRLLKT
tara:strand:- start:73 stop:798 length:726 start_codon:yes stop_codon:yes gene_type:complete